MLGDVESVMYAVNSSVPQGSVLGPLEFVAYTEDVVEIMQQYQLRHHIYADDLQLYANSTLKDVMVSCCSFKTASLTSVSGVHHAGCCSTMLKWN